MRNKILLAVILILPPALFLFFWLTPGAVKMPPAGENQTQTDQDAAVAKALATADPKTTAAIASNFAAPRQTVFYSVPPKHAVMPAGKPAPLEFTNMAPDLVLDKVRHVIHDYDSMFGGNPVGNNAEITSQLNGNNPKQANFIQPEDGMRMNEKGELVDPWGTPYFFHALSGHEMEIRSAGPDKIMWTADDLVTK
jgi:hypothetical protein